MGDIGDMNSILCTRMGKALSGNSGSFSPAYRKVVGLLSPMSPPISEWAGMNGLSVWGHGSELPPRHVSQVPGASHPSSARKEVSVTTNNRWS